MQIPPLALKTGAITLAVGRSFVGHKTNNFEGKKTMSNPHFSLSGQEQKREIFLHFCLAFWEMECQVKVWI
jgi:hypothetical protein